MTKNIAAIIAISIFLVSCKTYYIPVDSFKEQFAGMNKSNFKEVTVRGPLGNEVKYLTFPVAVIKCVDNKGNPVDLQNSPSLEIRFTNINNKKTIFYFDRIFVTETAVSGAQSRIINVTKTIPLETVKKIEIQNGKKSYSYVN